MKWYRRPFETGLIVVLMLVACAAGPLMLQAQTVAVTGTADVSEIHAKLDEQQDVIDLLRVDVDALMDEATKPDTGGSDPGAGDGGDSGGEPGGEPGADPGVVPGIGMNLADVAYWMRQWVFVDLTLATDAWRKDATGYVYSAGHPPPGDYVLTWLGTGSIDIGLGATVTARGDHHIELNIPPDSGGVQLVRTGRDQDVREMHMRPVGWVQGSSAFHPLFVERLKPFRVIRFMDWQKTNNSGARAWSDRTLPGDRQSTDRGVAIEHMIDLCNELGADPWFCMPHQADDEYVRRFAELVRDRLHHGATVYVEWSNEVWNTQFSQGRWVNARDGTDRDADAGNDGFFSNPFFDTWAAESQRDFAIWHDVLPPDRVVRVAAVQLQNPWVAKKLLARLDGQFDAVAPSAYFGIRSKQAVPSTVDGVIDLLADNIATDNTAWYQQHADLVAEYSKLLGRPIALISYEAGQHLTGEDPVISQAQRDSRMHGLYMDNMAAFEAAGGSLFTAFNYVMKPDKHGAWGHLAYQDQPTVDAPRYRALIER